jgi:hypothetical protein
MFNKPAILLRLEGLAVFGLTLFLYHLTGVSWTLFLVLFLWPDLGMLGYLANVKLGATLYNLVHTEALPVVLAGVSFAQHEQGALAFSLIWLAHIGFDRALGYGLKYATVFKDTHLQRTA